jgi:hypothetical protein
MADFQTGDLDRDFMVGGRFIHADADVFGWWAGRERCEFTVKVM